MLMARLAAVAEYDIKKLIAYSTLRQLGLMVFALGVGSSDLAFFHLLTHALFKALLFIRAGILIHHVGHEQDLRLMGNLVISFPVARVGFIVSRMALSGAPFMAAFYSKDLILELGVMGGVGIAGLGFSMGASVLTRFYAVRGFGLGFVASGRRAVVRRVCDGSVFFIVPVVGLVSVAVVGGCVIS